ncbi:MAG: hypothetical protein ACJATA_000604 [Sphingobacteriales bacterium]|jgi:uncharacterized protein
MLKKNAFTIPFLGLKNGEHSFKYSIDASFFEQLEADRISGSDLELNLIFEKADHMLQLHFDFDGTVTLNCDRCTSEFKQPIWIEESLIIKLSGPEEDTTDEIIFLPQDSSEIELKQFIYEFVVLSLPMIPNCEDAGIDGQSCDKDTIEEINKLNIANKDQKQDPRWDALKNLNLKS